MRRRARSSVRRLIAVQTSFTVGTNFKVGVDHLGFQIGIPLIEVRLRILCNTTFLVVPPHPLLVSGEGTAIEARQRVSQGLALLLGKSPMSEPFNAKIHSPRIVPDNRMHDPTAHPSEFGGEPANPLPTSPKQMGATALPSSCQEIPVVFIYLSGGLF